MIGLNIATANFSVASQAQHFTETIPPGHYKDFLSAFGSDITTIVAPISKGS